MEIVARSDTGKVRQNNEDAFAYDPEQAVAVLADGMGGLAAGEVASQVAVTTILENLQRAKSYSEPLLKSAVESANAAVRQAAVKACVDMGTTVVVWLLTAQRQCFVANVGDSRVYRIRAGKLRRLTTDHSMVQQMVEDGILNPAEAQTSSHRNVITRALGLDDHVEVDVHSWVTAPGDLYLLCSDGLTDMIDDAKIAQVIEAGANEVLGTMADALILSANEAGGHDNVSVLLIRPD